VSNFVFTIEGGKLALGLRTNKEAPRDSGFLVECIGAVGRDDILCALDELSKMDLSGFYFPYPQIFVLTKLIIVCTATEIYEWVDSALVLKLSGITKGHRWDLADYNEFVYLSNSKVAIRRDINGTYAATDELPVASAICNMNGQIVVSGRMRVVSYLTSRPYAVEVIEEAKSTGGSLTEGMYMLSLLQGDAGLEEAKSTGGALTEGVFRASVLLLDTALSEEAKSTGGALVEGFFAQTFFLVTYADGIPEEAKSTGGALVEGFFAQTFFLITYNNSLPEEAKSTGGALVEGTHGT